MLTLLFACVGPDDREPPAPTDPADSAVDSEAPPSWCEEQGLTERPWVEAEDSDALYATAADLTLQTTNGPVVLSELWTGCETFLFIPNMPSQATGWPDPIWTLKKDVRSFFQDLPKNTHVFFLVSEQANETDRLAKLDDLKAYVDAVVDEDAEHWSTRVHYVTDRAKNVDGWVGDHFSSPGFGAGVDRFQRIRYLGSFADPERYNSSYSWFEPNLAMAANEARFYNMESDREEALDSSATVIQVFDGDRVAGSTYVDVDLPTAEEMAAWDTLEIDQYMGCEGEGEYGYCPAWDYMAYLFVCAWAAEENPYADTACQPAVAEVMGLCEDGATECRTDEDCTAGDTGISDSCSGYSAAVSADTQGGTCVEADGTEHEGTHTCEEDGSGYGELSCGCNTELGRWITTYHREGRWVHDVSPLLPMLDDGVDHQFRFNTTGPYELDMKLRLSHQGKEHRAEELVYLYDGVSIRSGGYNESYLPLEVEIPADAAKVELVTVTTGHGMSQPGNCAEFCDLHHEWTINDTEPIVYDQPWVGDTFGCQTQVDDQTVPNQYGTWWYGRGGWCPGKHVDPVVTDITDRVTPGETATVWYQNSYNGEEYSGDNWSHTILTSWILISR